MSINITLVLFLWRTLVNSPLKQQLPLSASSQPLAIIILLSVTINLTTLVTLYRWNHTVFVVLWLAYCTQHYVLKVHPSCSTCQSSLNNIPLCVYAHFAYLFICWWTLGLLPPLFVCFCFFRATPAAYGGSQPRGQVRTVATGLCHRSRHCQILNPLSEARDQTYILMDTSRIRFCWAMMGTLLPSFGHCE